MILLPLLLLTELGRTSNAPAGVPADHDSRVDLVVSKGREPIGVPGVVGRSLDDQRYQVRFTPRRKGSGWSAINIAKIAELTEAGLMHPAGLQAFETRKPDRVAVYSYEQPADAVLDEHQTARFQADDAAWRWFTAQSPSYRRAAVHWVVSAKRADTRERRLAQLVADSAGGRKVPPLAPR